MQDDSLAGAEECEILLEVEDIHHALLECNKQHFNQEKNNPFGSGILYNLMGYSGISAAAKEIVCGDFLEKDDIPNLLPETHQVIAEMAMPEVFKMDPKNKLSIEIMTGDFIQGFKKWKESTSTSPLGCHLGHYKAIIKDTEDQEQSSKKEGGSPI